MALSYNGWAASPYPSRIGVVHFEPIPGYDFPGGIKDGDVKVVFTYLVQNLHKRVEPISIYKPGDEWGYNYRANVNNPNVLSCHASGTAIDYNATQHPNKVDFTWTRDQAREIHKIIDDELDGVIKWLEGYDEMHFEIRGTTTQVKRVADKIRNGTVNGPPPTPAPEPEEASLVYRIVWFGGEPTAAGDQADAKAAYRCLYAKREKSADKDPYSCVEGWWIKTPEELKVWQERGLLTMNKPETASPLRSTINLHGGPFNGIGG